jgi:hypothetical protein
MTVHDPPAAATRVIVPRTALSQVARRRIFLYPGALVFLITCGQPSGGLTPLQYFLQDTLHASDAEWGQWNAISDASYIPTFIVFGSLCRRFPLKSLLLWGTIIAATAALIAAAVMGLMGGIATAAYIDLIIRYCPAGLQGTMLMTSGGLTVIVSRFGDVLDTFLYQQYGGFTVCVVSITVVYALILPAILLIPKDLIVTADGQKLQLLDHTKDAAAS